ncbi:hypothetical protein DFJ73DRAFT_797239 [Zopfochytrium polystomum]|nr:hypothetical protein DFJ73DRAFT_797239 [Zopfochytrium polystomum]
MRVGSAETGIRAILEFGAAGALVLFLVVIAFIVVIIPTQQQQQQLASVIVVLLVLLAAAAAAAAIPSPRPDLGGPVALLILILILRRVLRRTTSFSQRQRSHVTFATPPPPPVPTSASVTASSSPAPASNVSAARLLFKGLRSRASSDASSKGHSNNDPAPRQIEQQLDAASSVPPATSNPLSASFASAADLPYSAPIASAALPYQPPPLPSSASSIYKFKPGGMAKPTPGQILSEMHAKDASSEPVVTRVVSPPMQPSSPPRRTSVSGKEKGKMSTSAAAQALLEGVLSEMGADTRLSFDPKVLEAFIRGEIITLPRQGPIEPTTPSETGTAESEFAKYYASESVASAEEAKGSAQSTPTPGASASRAATAYSPLGPEHIDELVASDADEDWEDIDDVSPDLLKSSVTTVSSSYFPASAPGQPSPSPEPRFKILNMSGANGDSWHTVPEAVPEDADDGDVPVPGSVLTDDSTSNGGPRPPVVRLSILVADSAAPPSTRGSVAPTSSSGPPSQHPPSVPPPNTQQFQPFSTSIRQPFSGGGGVSTPMSLEESRHLSRTAGGYSGIGSNATPSVGSRASAHSSAAASLSSARSAPDDVPYRSPFTSGQMPSASPSSRTSNSNASNTSGAGPKRSFFSAIRDRLQGGGGGGGVAGVLAMPTGSAASVGAAASGANLRRSGSASAAVRRRRPSRGSESGSTMPRPGQIGIVRSASEVFDGTQGRGFATLPRQM